MDTRAFAVVPCRRKGAEALLDARARVDGVEQITLDADGPTVSGRAHLQHDAFLRLYYNQRTGTMTFALIRDDRRL